MTGFDDASPSIYSHLLIRRIEPADWEIYRGIRLRALSSDPQAFSTTAAYANSLDEAYWIERTRATAISDTDSLWLAFFKGSPVGICGMFTESGRFNLGHMWVDPSHRNKGIGQKLVKAAVGWAGSLRHGAAIWLYVNVNQSGAIRLYSSCGFRMTGVEGPMSGRSGESMKEMVLEPR